MAVFMLCHTRMPFRTVCTSVPAKLMLSCMQIPMSSFLVQAGLWEVQRSSTACSRHYLVRQNLKARLARSKESPT